MSAGDVYTYTPTEHHCMEGLAIENERGSLIDWFWNGSIVSHRQIVSRDAAGLTFVANLGDYEMTDRDGSKSNAEYAPADRLTIHAQHGLQRTNYIRKGATPDLATKIDNAKHEVESAEAEMRSAKHHLEWARTKLSELEAEATE